MLTKQTQLHMAWCHGKTVVAYLTAYRYEKLFVFQSTFDRIDC